MHTYNMTPTVSSFCFAISVRIRLLFLSIIVMSGLGKPQGLFPRLPVSEHMVYKSISKSRSVQVITSLFTSHSTEHTMDAVTLINKPCLLCGKTTAMWCSRCQNAWYCSPDHLQSVWFFLLGPMGLTLTLPPRQDWPRHRGECVAVPAATHTTLPTGKRQTVTASALLFAPGDGDYISP